MNDTAIIPRSLYESICAENAKLIAERDILQNNIEGDADHIKSLEDAIEKLLAECEQYENHDVYATLYEEAKHLIDPHTKSSGGELPTSVIQSFEYLFKFWTEHKAEREQWMKQEPVVYEVYEDGVYGHLELVSNKFPKRPYWEYRPLYRHPLPAQQVPDVPNEEMLSVGVDSLKSGLKLFGENYTQIVCNIWEDMYYEAAPKPEVGITHNKK